MEQLQQVDLDQLHISNKMYQERINDKNADLMTLKSSSNKTVAAYNHVSESLRIQTEAEAKVVGELQSRTSMLQRLEKEHAAVLKEKSAAMSRNQKLKTQLRKYKAPSVLEYVKEKATLKDDRSYRRSMERRVELAEAELTRHRQLWNALETKSSAAWNPHAPWWCVDSGRLLNLLIDVNSAPKNMFSIKCGCRTVLKGTLYSEFQPRSISQSKAYHLCDVPHRINLMWFCSRG